MAMNNTFYMVYIPLNGTYVTREFHVNWLLCSLFWISKIILHKENKCQIWRCPYLATDIQTRMGCV